MVAIDRIVVINDFAAAQGGATAIALLAAREFRRQGHPVTYICGDKVTDELKQQDISVVALGSDALLDLPQRVAMRQGLHNTHAQAAIKRWIEQNDTPGTVYHVHNWSQILSPSIFRALRPVESRTVVTCHDFFNICPNGGFTHYRSSTPCELRPLSVRCLLSRCDRRNMAQKYWRVARHVSLNHQARFADSRCTFTVLHEKMKDRFIESGFAAKDIVSIPNPIEAWTSERIPAEQNEGFLFVGRIGRDKGADLAIRAARESRQHLTLVGHGELAKGNDEPDEHVKFVGWAGREEIARLASSARALIVPSRIVEPFGLVILEAGLSGLPVIVSSHAYLANDVVRLGFGMAFDMSKKHGLAEIMSGVADATPMVEEMSRAGFARAPSLCLSPEAWADTFIAIFERKLRAA